MADDLRRAVLGAALGREERDDEMLLELFDDPYGDPRLLLETLASRGIEVYSFVLRAVGEGRRHLVRNIVNHVLDEEGAAFRWDVFPFTDINCEAWWYMAAALDIGDDGGDDILVGIMAAAIMKTTRVSPVDFWNGLLRTAMVRGIEYAPLARLMRTPAIVRHLTPHTLDTTLFHFCLMSHQRAMDATPDDVEMYDAIVHAMMDAGADLEAFVKIPRLHMVSSLERYTMER